MNMLFGKKKDTAPPPAGVTDATTKLKEVRLRVSGLRSGSPRPSPHSATHFAWCRRARSQHVNSMQKREKFLDQKIAAELAKAKELSRKKDKRGAMMALKKKKLYEKEVAQIQNTTFQMEQQMMMLEQANMNKLTVDAIKTGAQAMKATATELNIDEVEDVMADVQVSAGPGRTNGDALLMRRGGFVRRTAWRKCRR